MKSLEEEILNVIRRQPERNPDGSLWRMHVGPKAYTKVYLLEAWSRDNVMRQQVIEVVLALKVHLLGRGPQE